MAEDALIFSSYIKDIKNVKTFERYLYNYNCENVNSATSQKNINQIKNHIKDLEYCIQKFLPIVMIMLTVIYFVNTSSIAFSFINMIYTIKI